MRHRGVEIEKCLPEPVLGSFSRYCPTKVTGRFFVVITIVPSAANETSQVRHLFPFHELLPSHIVGGISILVLFVAIVARYKRNLAGSWRRTYVITAMTVLYLNVFVLIVQGFRKAPILRALAPTGTEPPFKLVQGVVLIAFVFLAVAADKRFCSSSKGLGALVA